MFDNWTHSARYRGIIRPDDEAESLKRVIHFYKYQNQAALPDSVEIDSKEVNTASYQPAYRIDLDGKDEADSTDSPVVFSLTGSEASEEEEADNTVVTTIVPNPEEAEDETTTLFPVVKMEEFGIPSKKAAGKYWNLLDSTWSDFSRTHNDYYSSRNFES